VAINWCRAKGAVPIVGVKTLQQAKDNLACLSWDLKPAEVSHGWERWCYKGLGKDARYAGGRRCLVHFSLKRIVKLCSHPVVRAPWRNVSS
jgi:hypothetical protein